MLKGLGNIGQMLKQAQEFGGKLKEIQAELKTVQVTGSAGGGMVEVDMNGVAEVLAVRIEDSLMAKGDKEFIEDLLPAAINDAAAKAKEEGAKRMQALGGGLPIPGLSDLLGGGPTE